MTLSTWFGIGGTLFGLFGLAYAVRFYIELRKWAHLIKYARIVVAYKGKVKLNAPLQEWALWIRMLEEDEASNGRVLYQLGATRIAILRKSFVPDPPYLRAWKAVKARIHKPVNKVNPQVQEGTWSAEDHTEKVAK